MHSPPPRRISQVFSPIHGNTALPPGQSITVMSTKLAESSILSTFNLYDVILYTRAYVDLNTRAGPNTVPPPFCTGIHGDVIETVCTELKMQYQDLVLLSTPEIIRLFNTYFLYSGLLYPFQEALRAVKDRLSDTKNYFKMPVDRDTVQHTIFISRWNWILEHFPCVEHIGVQTLLQILPTLIPISNFPVLVQEQKCSSTEDIFTTLRTLGNEYNIHIRIQKSIARLNTQLSARLNREAHAKTPPSPYSGGAPKSNSYGGDTSSSKGQSDKRPPSNALQTIRSTPVRWARLHISTG